MKRFLPMVCAITIFVAGIAVVSPAQNDPARQFIGTWKLISTVQRMADGTSRPNPVYGPKGIGYIIYTDANRMCATLMDPTRPQWKSATAPDHQELQAIMDHFQAYCGTYEVNAAGGYVVHHVEMDKVPNNIGIDRKRFFKFTGNRLILTADPPPAGTTEYSLTWERVAK